VRAADGQRLGQALQVHPQLAVVAAFDALDGVRVDDGTAVDLPEALRVQRLLQLAQRRAQQQVFAGALPVAYG
jgi:hypothetical protein